VARASSLGLGKRGQSAYFGQRYNFWKIPFLLKKNLRAAPGSTTLFNTTAKVARELVMQMLTYEQTSAIRTQPWRARSAQTAPTFRTLGHSKLAGLCDALDMAGDLDAATQLFDLFGETWADRTRTCSHPESDITDDSSPFEFSIALEDGRPELRMLAEAQGALATPMSNWAAAWQLTEQLGRIYGVSLTRAHLIADLFEPTGGNSVFGLWHAACLRPGRTPTLKLYFNPAARGSDMVDASIKEAMTRLGQLESYEWLREHAMLRGDKDTFAYMSIDLGDHAEARTKVYIAHRDATAFDIEHAMSGVDENEPGDAIECCVALADTCGPFTQRPLLTCFAFVAGKREPITATLHLPIRCYSGSDQVVLERIGLYLSPTEARLHERAVHSMATRSLDARTGMQTYASFRRVEGRRRLTVYLSPEVYSAP
jgi:DMATS type aromatic prenyltransferase